jgi:hypothetical protein
MHLRLIAEGTTIRGYAGITLDQSANHSSPMMRA